MTHTGRMSTPIEGDWARELFGAWMEQNPTFLADAEAALFPPTIPACLAGPRRTPRPLVNEHDAAILRAAGAHEDTFDVSPDVPR